MSSSLQEQLVQAGLAEEQPAEKSRKRGKHRAGGQNKKGRGKNRNPGQTGKRTSAAPARAQSGAETPAAKESGPRREPTAAEKADRLRQMIRANRIDRAYAGVPYRFTQASTIREIAVTGTQHARIARGELAVVSDGERWELVPAKIARRIRGSDPQAVLVLNGENDGATSDGDDPYADYPVPDDLMW